MKKTDLVIGLVIGLLATILGTYLFLKIETQYSFVEGITMIKAQGFLGKLITLGALLNLGIFFLLLKLQKEVMARGVVLATLLLAIITLFM